MHRVFRDVLPLAAVGRLGFRVEQLLLRNHVILSAQAHQEDAMSRNRKAARLDSRQATAWKMFSLSGHIPASCRNHRGFRSVGASLARKHLDVLNGGNYTLSAPPIPP